MPAQVSAKKTYFQMIKKAIIYLREKFPGQTVLVAIILVSIGSNYFGEHRQQLI